MRQTGGKGQFGHVGSRSSRRSRARASSSRTRSSAASVPREYIPAVETGCPGGAGERRRCAGYPVVDVKVTLVDGSYHEVDSSEMAFKIAGSMAFKEAVRKGAPQVLEPIMKVEVTTPEDFMGDVIGDLNARRGQIEGDGAARQRAGDPRRRAAGEDVRLRDRPALDDAGPRDLLDGVRSLRSRCREHSPTSWRQESTQDRVAAVRRIGCLAAAALVTTPACE